MNADDNTETDGTVSLTPTNWRDLWFEPDPGADWLIEGLIYKNATHSIAGESGSGKSWLAYDIARRVAARCEHVIIVDEEMGARQASDRFKSLDASYESMQYVQHYSMPAINWTAPEHLRAFGRELDEYKPALIILDSSARALSNSGLNENDSGQVDQMWNVFLALKNDGYSVLIIDHTGKGDANGHARGSSAKKAACEVQFIVAQRSGERFSREKAGGFRLSVSKDRLGYLEQGSEIAVSIATVDGALRVSLGTFGAATDLAESAGERIRRDIVAHLDVAGECSMTDIKDNVQGRAADISGAVASLESDGKVSVRPGPRNGRYVSAV